MWPFIHIIIIRVIIKQCELKVNVTYVRYLYLLQLY